jgi:phosphatidylethanolamine/phosphatidyl-N-methylethanolamine N-methyltransferase
MQSKSTPSSGAAFIQRFIKHPAQVGTIAATSPVVSRRLAEPIPETGDPLVVELGPGTGAVTEWIRRRLNGRGHLLTIEIDPVFAEMLRTNYPDLDIAVADAGDLSKLLADRGLGAVDVVVSALPWTLFSDEQTRRILSALAASMTPDGVFTTITYTTARMLPPWRRVLAALNDTFESVEPSRAIWRNIPPAYVYEARRPRSQNPA